MAPPSESTGINVSRLLEDGIALTRSGQRAEAQTLFRRVIQIAPELEDGWLWMAWLAETREQGLGYLREGLRFAPDSERLREGIAWVQAHKPAAPRPEPPSEPAAASPKRQPAKRVSAATRLRPATRPRAAAQPAAERAAPTQPPQARIWWGRVSTAVRSLGVTAFSVGAVALLALLVYALLANRLAPQTTTISAMVLPTPVLDATPTPGVEQLARPYWTRVEVAWTQEDWNAAIGALENVRELDPRNDDARRRLSEALYMRARVAIDANELEAASRDLDRAVRLDAESRHLQSARRDIELYRDAVEAYLEQDWARAVFMLTQVYNRTPDFRDTRPMLGQAHCNLAKQQMEADNLDEALAQAKLCEEILRGDPDAAAVVQTVMDTIRPPRRIEVSLSRFRVQVFEEHQVVRTFVVCIGRPSHPTRTGRFEVQSKIDMAFASTWELYMPSWLGIYWAGGSENGFHALPILRSGATLWAGALGTRCSFGCIVLDTDDAAWLYEWAQIGTVVIIER